MAQQDASGDQNDPDPLPGASQRAQDDAVRICRDLLRIDTSNFGDGSGPGERAAAEYVAAELSAAGLQPTILESVPGRASVIARVAGRDPSRPALVLHGHLDVVPALPQDWRIPPFAGEEHEGCLWGRGAVDMKDMVAMIIAVAQDFSRRNLTPARDVVLAFPADEEAGGTMGAQYLVREHAHLFEGATEAVGEVGGFSVQLGQQRAYLIQTAEKGIAWMRLVAHGLAGHGSAINTDNAITHLARAVTAVGSHPWPIRITPTVRKFLDGVEQITGRALPTDDPDALVAQLGPVAQFVGATLRTTVNPTMLNAGYKNNVVPGEASAALDARMLPGDHDHMIETVTHLVGENVKVVVDKALPAIEAPFEADIVDAMGLALSAEDPDAALLPYCLSAGTDNKHFASLGMQGYGFAPLQLPPDLDFVGMFHGINERVPIPALHFGTRVLGRFLAAC